MNHGWLRLRQELSAWSASGLVARFWWRDDDAVTVTPQLDRLLALSREFDVGAGLAVVPERADVALVDAIAESSCCIWQHGWGHHFHAAGEFGDGRPLEAMMTDALNGRNALDELCGRTGWQRVFVPPNHCLAMPFKSLIPALGYRVLSAGVPLTPELPHVAELNAEIDVMDWPRGAILDVDALDMLLASQLHDRRAASALPSRPIGILTHHPVFNDHAWTVVGTLFDVVRSHPAAMFEHANVLAQQAVAPESPLDAHGTAAGVAPCPGLNGDIAVVITSCGRQDLLARTLDSFFEHNTAAIREVVVIEDGDGGRNDTLRTRWSDRPIRWLATGARVGQIAAIDQAYRVVDAEYIFHCEDDWEFYAPGFIEKSLAILQENPRILQVWLRALGDTNNTVVLEPRLLAENTTFRYLHPSHHTEEWGTWHGFSFNPGLRRRRDYTLVGTFAGLNPDARLKAWEVERAASDFYFKRGFLVTILADQGGEGYVRHLGWERRVPEPGAADDSSAVQ
ncbi:MAG: glycosyltransferase [Gemmatimonadales bacterium]|nr:glycosyltransferase [Gemmatimonadales bacterium]